MPPHPLVPAWRVVFPYSVLGRNHVGKFYLATAVNLADPSGYNTVARTGFVGVGVSTITAPWWNVIKTKYKPGDATFGNAHLDNLVAGAWVPVWYEANAIVGTSAGPTTPAGQITIAGYTTSHERTRTFLFESAEPVPERAINYATMSANTQAIINAIFNSGASAGNTNP